MKYDIDQINKLEKYSKPSYYSEYFKGLDWDNIIAPERTLLAAKIKNDSTVIS